MGTFNLRENGKSEEERDRAIDHPPDFLNVNYVPATEVARSLNVRPESQRVRRVNKDRNAINSKGQ